MSGTQSQSPSQSQTQTQTRTASVTQTASRTSTPIGSVMFDGTQSRSASVFTGPSDCVSLSSSTIKFAVSFQILETDSSCGPGQYSLTEMSLALAQSASVTSASFFVQLFTTDPASGFPLGLITSKGVSSVSIPASGGYVALPLSGLQPDTGGVRGTNYSLVISALSAVRWCSVSSAAVDNIPTSGTAVVYSSSVYNPNTASWSSSLPYRGILLKALKLTCAASTSQTASGTLSQTPSQIFTPSQSPSSSLSISATPSTSASSCRTPSQSPTRSQTPVLVWLSSAARH